MEIFSLFFKNLFCFSIQNQVSALHNCFQGVVFNFFCNGKRSWYLHRRIWSWIVSVMESNWNIKVLFDRCDWWILMWKQLQTFGEWLLDCKWSWFDHEPVKRGKQFHNWRGENVLYQHTLWMLAFLVQCDGGRGHIQTFKWNYACDNFVSIVHAVITHFWALKLT